VNNPRRPSLTFVPDPPPWAYPAYFPVRDAVTVSLLTLDELRALRSDRRPPARPGLYFLFWGLHLQYVGQAEDLRKRGPTRRAFPFHSIAFVDCHKCQLDVLEMRYIEALDPPENKAGRTTKSCYSLSRLPDWLPENVEKTLLKSPFAVNPFQPRRDLYFDRAEDAILSTQDPGSAIAALREVLQVLVCEYLNHGGGTRSVYARQEDDSLVSGISFDVGPETFTIWLETENKRRLRPRSFTIKTPAP